MRSGNKFFFIASVSVNILLISWIVYKKSSVIIAKFNSPEITYATPKKEDLAAMNKVKIPLFKDTTNNIKGKPYKVLIVGNSIAYHSVAKDIGWNHLSGMAATTTLKDYPHLLFDKIETILPKTKIIFRISNLADFERNFSSYNTNKLDSLVNYKADIIIFQLGENVSFDAQNPDALFEQKYISLINTFKKNNHPLIICTTPFFSSYEKNKVISSVVLNTHSYLVDLSNLALLSSDNVAANDPVNKIYKNSWKAIGIGMHPGDTGMQNIAESLFIVINAAIGPNKKNT